MSQRSAKDLLENAYALGSAEANASYYRDFSEVYDSGFADELGYASPARIADFFQRHATIDNQPIADIGCGTGLVAESLPSGTTIDGFDLSIEMLEKARTKEIYRDLRSIDLTKPIQSKDRKYSGLISAGTFTLGHLGPKDLENCLGLLQPNGFCAVTIAVVHFQAENFEMHFQRLMAANKITPPIIETVPIYSKSGHSHSADETHLVGFRTRG